MNTPAIAPFARAAALCVALPTLGACAAPGSKVPTNLHYERIVLSADPVNQPLLNGPPQTGAMRSGRVVLKPGQDMHRHSTEGNEELLVFLQGKARLLLGSETVNMEAGQVLYIPPQTEHEVHNDGQEELRYIYIVAPAGH